MKVGSLFSGIGGFDLGLERAGMEVSWQCEDNEYCQRVLNHRWPKVPCYGDIRELRKDIPAVDLLCGGFPCQPVSYAGKRQGKRDDRWIWPEFSRVIGLVRPTFIIVENVPGILHGGYEEVLGSLAALGYDAEWDCISASDFGAPHERERIWLVAYTISESVRLQRKLERQKQAFFVLDGPFRELAHTYQEKCRSESYSDWAFEPDVGRVAHGLPDRVDRLQSLGNSLVPPIAEYIGRRILAASS